MFRNRERTVLRGLFLIVLFYAVVEHFGAVRNILLTCYKAVSPLLYGIVIAFVVNLIVVKVEKYMTKGIFENQAVKRAASMVIAFLILIGAITIVCFSLIPEIVESVRQITERVPKDLDTLLVFLETHFDISGDIADAVRNIQVDEDLVDSVLGLIENQSVLKVLKASKNMVGTVFSVIAKIFIGLFFAFYILAKKEAIGAYIHKLIKTYLPERIGSGLEHFGTIVYDAYAGFISGQCLNGVILGCMVMFTMGIMRLPYPVLMGSIIAVTALIPVVGAVFGATVGAVLLVMDSPVKALTFLILFLVLKQIDNRLIYPNIVGNAIGIPSILIFATIIIGGELGGVIGMFLGIPFTAVIYTLVDQDMEKRGH